MPAALLVPLVLSVGTLFGWYAKRSETELFGDDESPTGGSPSLWAYLPHILLGGAAVVASVLIYGMLKPSKR